MLFSCLFRLLSRGSVHTVFNSDQVFIAFVWLYVSWLHSQGMGWQRHLLGYHGQLFLQFWQTQFDTCLLGFVWGVVLGETMIASGMLNFRRCCALRLEGNSQNGINPICVFSERYTTSCCTVFHDCLRPLVLAGMHPVYLVGSLLEPFVKQPCAC